MALTAVQTRDLYRRRAGRYDSTVRLLRIAGIDLERYRRETIAALELSPGDIVVELGCGTGLNFDHVERLIGPQGRPTVLDMKDPPKWPRWLVRFVAWLNAPFGVSLDLSGRHPWESVASHLQVTDYREYFRGALYLCTATRPVPDSQP